MRLGNYLSSMTKPEIDRLQALLNLTDDEYAVFVELSKGRSKIAIADKCLISVSTVSNRISAIQSKVIRLKEGGFNERL